MEWRRRNSAAPVRCPHDLTAHADDGMLERAKRTEPHGYLIKPFKTAELRRAIEISIHKHAMAKRLREREQWFSTTLRSIADAVVTVDLAGNITFMNSAAELLTGATLSEAQGKPARDILRLGPGSTDGDDPPLTAAPHGDRVVALHESTLRNVWIGAASSMMARRRSLTTNIHSGPSWCSVT